MLMQMMKALFIITLSFSDKVTWPQLQRVPRTFPTQTSNPLSARMNPSDSSTEFMNHVSPPCPSLDFIHPNVYIITNVLWNSSLNSRLFTLWDTSKSIMQQLISNNNHSKIEYPDNNQQQSNVTKKKKKANINEQYLKKAMLKENWRTRFFP